MLCTGLLIIFVCQEPKPPPVTSAARFCQVARPMPWSRHDTPQTQRQAKAHNAAGVKLCGWRPARK